MRQCTMKLVTLKNCYRKLHCPIVHGTREWSKVVESIAQVEVVPYIVHLRACNGSEWPSYFVSTQRDGRWSLKP